MRARILAICAVCLLAIIGACSVPGDGPAQKIDAVDVAFGLADTTTTAATTTTAPPTTIRETTTTVEATTTTSEPATTAATKTEPVDLYFVSGTRLIKTTQDLVSPAQPEIVIRRLLAGPPEGFRSSLPVLDQPDASEIPDVDLPIQVVRNNGIAEVTVPASFSEIDSEGQLAFGQIVLSLVNVDRIGGVVFLIDGVAIQVVTGDGSLTDPGDPVTYEDYIDLVAT